MPILPLDHLEPLAATVGVMLYPGLEDGDPAKARAFAARFLAKPIARSYEAGHRLPSEVLASLFEQQDWLSADLDVDWRIWGGSATGELTKVLFSLSRTHPELASWENAIRIFEANAGREKGTRSWLRKALSQFVPVAHLWAAWTIRDRDLITAPDLGYDGWTDFQMFLTEAEILRDWGQFWRAPRAKSEPPLHRDVWQVPDDWRPLVRRADWPMTGMIQSYEIPGHLLKDLRPPGRPRTSP